MKKRCIKAAAVYAVISLLCVIFAGIYEMFSFGEYSAYMLNMYLVPLLGGTVLYLLIYKLKGEEVLSRFAFNVWNTGIAVMTSWCMVKGIVEISGRSFEYDMLYCTFGGIMLIIGFMAQCIAIQRR